MKKIGFLFLMTLISNSSFAISVEEHTAVYETYTLEAQGKYGKAIEKMTKMLEGKSDDYFINYRLGWLFSLEKKYKNSVDHYKKAAASNPKALEPWLALSLLHLNLLDYKNVMNYADEVIKRDPESYYGNQRYILAALRLKEYSSALEKVDEILKAYPTDAVFLEQRAFALGESGNYELAKKAVADLLLVSPSNAYGKYLMSKPKQ
jgi:tetratricopeptide (TPR) repeat protein